MVLAALRTGQLLGLPHWPAIHPDHHFGRYDQMSFPVASHSECAETTEDYKGNGIHDFNYWFNNSIKSSIYYEAGILMI